MLFYVDDLENNDWNWLYATDAESHKEAAQNYITALGIKGEPSADITCAERLLVWADKNGLIRYGSKKTFVFGISKAS